MASVCAGKASSVDALAGGVGAATAASALSVTPAVAATVALEWIERVEAVEVVVAVEQKRVKGCGSTVSEYLQPGSLPCLGTGMGPYFEIL